MLPYTERKRSKPRLAQYTNQRSSPRSFVVCPISIAAPAGTTHGIVRDISTGGIFFYSNFKPSLKMNIDFTLIFNDKRISGSGEVIRVEQGLPGAAIGVALKIANCDNWSSLSGIGL
jgi:PilZ domain